MKQTRRKNKQYHLKGQQKLTFGPDKVAIVPKKIVTRSCSQMIGQDQLATKEDEDEKIDLFDTSSCKRQKLEQWYYHSYDQQYGFC